MLHPRILRAALAVWLILGVFFVSNCFAQGGAKASPAAKKSIVLRTVRVKNVPYLMMADVAAFYGFSTSRSGAKSYVFSSRTSRLVLTLDSRKATLNSVTINLAFAPRLQGTSLLLSHADFACYLDPILRPQMLPKKSIQRIVIDAGHGGKDPGCKGSVLVEKTVNLQMAMLLANALVKAGYTVAVTRQGDTFLTLDQRVALSTKFKPDLFISLHCNSAGESARGVEVFCATPFGTPPSDSDYISPKKCAANACDRQNAYIAYYVQKRIKDALGLPDRGVKHKRFVVIAGIPAPSILVEMGFLSNATDQSILQNQKNRQRMVDAIVTAITNFRDVSKVPLKK